jgi:hypothetical protein
MAVSTELARTSIITEDGVLTATVVDTVSVDRLYVMLVNSTLGARYGNISDTTNLVPRAVKNLVIFPFTEP